jgi:4-hydroxy-tetrahydrodipicolinate synthase
VDPAASAFARDLAGGLVPAVPVPHRADGTYDAAAQDAYAAWMATQPVAGVAAWAHTGRGLHLPFEVAGQVLTSWRAALPKTKRLIAGVGARPQRRSGGARVTPPADPLGLTRFVVERTLQMAHEAKDLGADAVLVFPPVLLKDLEDQERRVVDVHAALEEVGLPMVAFYLYQAAGGMPYSERVLDRILALPHLAGIKVATLDSVMTFQEVAARVPADRLLISGEDRFLGYSLMMGAKCALVGLGAARPDLTAALVAAHHDRDWAAFHRLSALVDRFGLVTFRDPMDGYIRRMLRVLARDRVIPSEAAHDPWGPEVPPWQLEEIERALPVLEAAAAVRS